MYIIELKTSHGIEFIDLDRMYSAEYTSSCYTSAKYVEARFAIFIEDQDVISFTKSRIKPAMEAIRLYANLTRERASRFLLEPCTKEIIFDPKLQDLR